MLATAMSTERETIEDVFRLVIEASGKLWDAVAVIGESESERAASLVQPLMQARGNLHVQLLRPMYLRYPELATKFGLDEEPDQ